MSAAAIIAMSFWEWCKEFYELNVDEWVAWGWFSLAILTIIACISMVLRIFKSNKGMRP